MSCGHVRIALSEVASDALRAAGEAFVIVGRGSYPEAPGRMVIHCLPIPKRQADAACRVAMGTHRAVKIKTPDASNTRARAREPKTGSGKQDPIATEEATCDEKGGGFSERYARARETGVLAGPKKEGEEEPK